jgi:hypothetical protein
VVTLRRATPRRADLASFQTALGRSERPHGASAAAATAFMPSSRGSHTSLPVVPGGPRAVAAELKARIETLEAELAQLEGVSAGHRADFERERDRCERLMAEVLKTTANLMVARRFSDAGRPSAWIDSAFRRPKTCTEPAAKRPSARTGNRCKLRQRTASGACRNLIN